MKSIIAALIIAAGMIAAVLIYVHNTPFERCVRLMTQAESTEEPLSIQLHCLRMTET